MGSRYNSDLQLNNLLIQMAVFEELSTMNVEKVNKDACWDHEKVN